MGKGYPSESWRLMGTPPITICDELITCDVRMPDMFKAYLLYLSLGTTDRAKWTPDEKTKVERYLADPSDENLYRAGLIYLDQCQPPPLNPDWPYERQVG